MPALAPVVLTNAEAADKSFAPRGIDSNGVATLVNSSGVPIGDGRLNIARTRTAQGREKTTFKLTVPVVQTETIGGIGRPTVVRTAYADVSFSFDGASDVTERANVRAMVADLLGSSQTLAVDTVDNLQSLY